jgi:membrane protein DedA with SNARE-associated domain
VSLESFIATYGAIGLFVGAAVEGETVATIGGMTAHRGLMSLPLAFGSVFTGTLAADQAWFAAGRHWRDRPMIARLRNTDAYRLAQQKFDRNPALFVILFRFMVGLRTVSPVMIGTSGFPPARFILLNVLAALVWTSLFVGAGYLFGLGLETWFGRIKDHRDWAPYLLIPVVAVALFKFLRRARG